MVRRGLERETASFIKIRDSNIIRISLNQGAEESKNVYGFLAGRTIFEDSGVRVESSSSEILMDLIRENLDTFSDVQLRFKDESIQTNSLIVWFLFPALGDIPDLDVLILPDQTLAEFRKNLNSFMLQASAKPSLQQLVQNVEINDVSVSVSI